MAAGATTLGHHLRSWRERRRLSQLDLACGAEISTRHLSFVETGRAAASRDVILRLAEHLELPVRERNVLLIAGGFAPLFRECALSAPELIAAREAVELLLAAHKPYPAFALDRHWNVVASNGALPQLYHGVAAELMAPPLNVVRLSLHPLGLAPRIINLNAWRDHMLGRLRRQIELTADPVLIALQDEASAYGRPAAVRRREAHPQAEVLVPLRVRLGDEVVSFLSTTMVFGTAIEVTLSELMLESFFPADPETAAIVARLAASAPE